MKPSANLKDRYAVVNGICTIRPVGRDNRPLGLPHEIDEQIETLQKLFDRLANDSYSLVDPDFGKINE